MPCVLCLKDTNGRNRRIEFSSSKAEELDIKTIIDLHLWRQIKNAPGASEFICKHCWSCLSTFHQFYLTIENAHALFMESQRKVAESDVKEYEPEPEPTISIFNQTENENVHAFLMESVTLVAESNVQKYEPEPEPTISNDNQTENEDEFNVTISPEPTKRKRGRPRRQPLPVGIDEVFLMEDNADKTKLNEIKIELPEPDPTIIDALAENISLEKLVETAYSDNTPDSEDNSKETRRLRQRKPKRTTKKKPLKKVKKRTKRSSPTSKAERAKKIEESNEYIKNNIKLQCSICNESLFLDFANLLAHYRKEHNERGFMLCCERKYYRREFLVDHLYTHKNPDYFKCQLCGKVLTDRFCLLMHMKVHVRKQIGRIYKCAECSKSFYNKVILKRHVLTHIPEKDRTVPCNLCDKQFPDDYSMKQHYYLTHLNKYVKICEVCGKSIQGNEAFDRHMQEHIMGKRLLLNCDICGASIRNKWGLARHKKMMHTEENLKPMKCPICSKISPTFQAHQAHIKITHKTERKHQCSLCDKAFKFPKGLREHMAMHTGETLYTCPHCPRTFNSNANMHSHRKKMHRAEWEANRRRWVYGEKSQDATQSASSTSNTMLQNDDDINNTEEH